MGLAPYPNKWVIGFERVAILTPRASSIVSIPVSIESMTRYAESGDAMLFPRDHKLALNNKGDAIMPMSITGAEMVIGY